MAKIFSSEVKFINLLTESLWYLSIGNQKKVMTAIRPVYKTLIKGNKTATVFSVGDSNLTNLLMDLCKKDRKEPTFILVGVDAGTFPMKHGYFNAEIISKLVGKKTVEEISNGFITTALKIDGDIYIVLKSNPDYKSVSTYLVPSSVDKFRFFTHMDKDLKRQKTILSNDISTLDRRLEQLYDNINLTEQQLLKKRNRLGAIENMTFDSYITIDLSGIEGVEAVDLQADGSFNVYFNNFYINLGNENYRIMIEDKVIMSKVEIDMASRGLVHNLIFGAHDFKQGVKIIKQYAEEALKDVRKEEQVNRSQL